MAGAMPGTASTLNSAKPFQPRELGFVDASGAAAFGAVVDLGGEDFGEVAEVGVAFPVGDLGQAGRFGADGGQVQFAGGGADGGLRGGVDGRRLVAVVVMSRFR